MLRHAIGWANGKIWMVTDEHFETNAWNAREVLQKRANEGAFKLQIVNSRTYEYSLIPHFVQFPMRLKLLMSFSSQQNGVAGPRNFASSLYRRFSVQNDHNSLIGSRWKIFHHVTYDSERIFQTGVV